MVVTKVWQSMCGGIRGDRTPAVSASRRSRRVAACRSILVPRVFSRIGPAVRVATADGPGHRWWQRHQHHLGALADDSQDAVAVFLAQVGDVRAGGFEDPQPEQAQHRHQREIVGVRRVPGGGQHRLELQVSQPQGG